MRFLEEGHDFGILRIIELRLQLVEFRDGFVVQVAVLVPFEERHSELVHRIVHPVVLALDPALEELDKAGGGDVGPFVELLYLVAADLDTEILTLDPERHLPGRLQLPVFPHHMVEGIQFVGAERVQALHLGDGLPDLLLHAEEEVGPDALIGVAALEGLLALFFLFLHQ